MDLSTVPSSSRGPSAPGQAPGAPDWTDRAASLVDGVARLAPVCESEARVPAETVERFKAAGLHRALMPARYGGHEVGFGPVVETSFLLGRECASTAWVLGLYMAHGWLGALFPKEAQDDIWGENPDALISGSYAPIGKATPVDGGYRLSGRFPFASGVPGADWNLCGAMLPLGPEGKPMPAFTIVPKSDYVIDWESWRPVGLAGTGSYDVLVDDVFVPAHRVLTFADSTGCTSPGADASDNPLYRVSLLTNVPFSLATPSVAAAAGALERFVEENRVRETHGAVVLGGKKIADFQTVQKRIGEASARIDACLMLARRDVAEAEAEARAEGKTTVATRMRNRRTQALIAHDAQVAMNLVFDAVGGRGLQSDHPTQRAWRDVSAVNHHISLNFDAVMSMYGQHTFGLPPEGQY
jgi:alkylation response protein AidB-like acyl-CoA dehydrogenase